MQTNQMKAFNGEMYRVTNQIKPFRNQIFRLTSQIKAFRSEMYKLTNKTNYLENISVVLTICNDSLVASAIKKKHVLLMVAYINNTCIFPSQNHSKSMRWKDQLNQNTDSRDTQGQILQWQISNFLLMQFTLTCVSDNHV